MSDEADRADLDSYMDRLMQTAESKTVTLQPLSLIHEGDQITIRMRDGSKRTGTIQSCRTVDDLNYEATVNWDGV